mmetsp:Transcript_10068/g.12711  ORF Transcript_10068/g.12711 Transcript_10068/m.12711 type:complete len:183 (+) Transcript_10068:96-644(+)
MTDREMIRQRVAQGFVNSNTKASGNSDNPNMEGYDDDTKSCCNKIIKRRRLSHVLGALLLVFLFYIQIGLLFVFDLNRFTFKKLKKSSLRKNAKHPANPHTNTTAVIESKSESKGEDEDGAKEVMEQLIDIEGINVALDENDVNDENPTARKDEEREMNGSPDGQDEGAKQGTKKGMVKTTE